MTTKLRYRWAQFRASEQLFEVYIEEKLALAAYNFVRFLS